MSLREDFVEGAIQGVATATVESISEKQIVWSNYEQLANMVKEKFLLGADAEFKKEVLKAAKGKLFKGKTVTSKDGRYSMRVDGFYPRSIIDLILNLFVGKKKFVIIDDNKDNKSYRLDKDRSWKKFYKTIVGASK